jgi:hypothetical protein
MAKTCGSDTKTKLPTHGREIPTVQSRHNALEAHIVKLAREAGLAIYIQGDCRGVAVYVRAKGQEIDDTNYSTHAHALHYGRGI